MSEYRRDRLNRVQGVLDAIPRSLPSDRIFNIRLWATWLSEAVVPRVRNVSGIPYNSIERAMRYLRGARIPAIDICRMIQIGWDNRDIVSDFALLIARYLPEDNGTRAGPGSALPTVGLGPSPGPIGPAPFDWSGGNWRRHQPDIDQYFEAQQPEIPDNYPDFFRVRWTSNAPIVMYQTVAQVYPMLARRYRQIYQSMNERNVARRAFQTMQTLFYEEARNRSMNLNVPENEIGVIHRNLLKNIERNRQSAIERRRLREFERKEQFRKEQIYARRMSAGYDPRLVAIMDINDPVEWDPQNHPLTYRNFFNRLPEKGKAYWFTHPYYRALEMIEQESMFLNDDKHRLDWPQPLMIEEPEEEVQPMDDIIQPIDDVIQPYPVVEEKDDVSVYSDIFPTDIMLTDLVSRIHDNMETIPEDIGRGLAEEDDDWEEIVFEEPKKQIRNAVIPYGGNVMMVWDNDLGKYTGKLLNVNLRKRDVEKVYNEPKEWWFGMRNAVIPFAQNLMVWDEERGRYMGSNLKKVKMDPRVEELDDEMVVELPATAEPESPIGPFDVEEPMEELDEIPRSPISITEQILRNVPPISGVPRYVGDNSWLAQQRERDRSAHSLLSSRFLGRAPERYEFRRRNHDGWIGGRNFMSSPENWRQYLERFT